MEEEIGGLKFFGFAGSSVEREKMIYLMAHNFWQLCM